MNLYLVRHGSAGTRDDSDPADTERHLDAYGLRQAAQLAERLGALTEDDSQLPITTILSSPAARCVETVGPLASSLGIDIGIDDRLLEGTDIDRTWGLVETLVEHGEVAVLCSHGDVIPELIRRAKGRGMEVPGKSGCSKGSLWMLAGEDGRFLRGVYETNQAQR